VKAIVTSVNAFVRVAIRDVEPYQAEVILSSYAREECLFSPVYVEVSFTALGPGDTSWPAVRVTGRTEGKRASGRHATVKLEEDENGLIDHWPDYARIALAAARKAVRVK